MIKSDAQVEGPIPHSYIVLKEKCQLANIRVAAILVQSACGARATIVRRQRSCSRQVNARQQWIVGWVGLKRAGAVVGIRKGWIGIRTSICVEAYRIESWINDTKRILLGKDSVLINDSRFDVVDAFQVRDVGAAPDIGQPAILPDRVGF